MNIFKLQKLTITVIGIFFLLICLNIAQTEKIDNETIKIMPFVQNNSSCQECHSSDELEQKGKDLTKGCDNSCMKCHKENLGDSHHKVGLEISFEIPDDIFLRKKKLACVSCHDLKNKRFSNEPWKSQSLFGRMFKSKSKYKTFYLIKNNNKGKLCKYCH